MKKNLLTCLILSVAMTAVSQNNHPRSASGVDNTARRIAARLQAEANVEALSASPGASTSQNNDEPEASAAKTSSYVSNWKAIGNSQNAFGVAIGTTRPLQYNDELNAVSFIQRASAGYPATPAPSADASSGVIVALVTQDWGTNWDSTCLWNDNTNWARYPQGGIVNSVPGNTNIANAHMVSMTAITQQNASLGWIGSGFSAKPLNSYNTTAPATTTFFPTQSPQINRTSYSIYDFQATDNGKAQGLGLITNNFNSTVTAVFGYRGASITKGSFVSGNMIWSSDSIIPNVLMSDGNPALFSRPRMAWSEDGQVGYVMHIGIAASATLSNRGYQPIIHRTGDGGISWAPVSGIDFEAPTMSVVAERIFSTRTNTDLTVPFFDFGEGIGMTVDKDNKLHIASLVRGTSSAHIDSAGYTYRFVGGGGQRYAYRHSPGVRPFLFDFIGDGLPNSPWKVTLVDSLSSEGPETRSSVNLDGYSVNPWVEYNGSKLGVESRIQLSRTPDGKYIVYSWAESDTMLTTSQFKWNEFPNIKLRLMDVAAQSIHTLEINATRPGSNYPFIQPNSAVSNRGYLHFISPKCAMAQTTAVGSSGPALILPITTSRPITNLMNSDGVAVHRYTSALLNFGAVPQSDIIVPGLTTGIAENALNSVNAGYVYPNPAKGTANLFIDLNDNSTVRMDVLNIMGQVIKSQTEQVTVGENVLPIDLNGLSKGIYMVNVKIGTVTSTKKLIVE